MTKAQRARLRVAIIAGPGDAVLSPPEAAALMDVSESWLRRSDVGVRMRLAGKTYEEIGAQLGTSVYQVVTVYTKYRPEIAATTTGSAT